jgi:hypothetical protein
LVNGVDPWNKKLHCREETETGTEINQPDLQSAKAVFITVDRLELGINTVRGCKYQGLVTGHGDNDGLKENPSGDDNTGNNEEYP